MANDEIDRLNDEIEAWVRRYDNAMIGRQMWQETAEAYERQTERLNTENARLREALKPFACNCGPYRCRMNGDDGDRAIA